MLYPIISRLETNAVIAYVITDVNFCADLIHHW